MRRVTMWVAAGVGVSLAFGSGPLLAQREGKMEEALHQSYQNLLKELDKNKDGKLSVEECASAFKENSKGQEKCRYWDANGDGIITEDEYVKQGMKITEKK